LSDTYNDKNIFFLIFLVDHSDLMILDYFRLLNAGPLRIYYFDMIYIESCNNAINIILSLLNERNLKSDSHVYHGNSPYRESSSSMSSR